MPRNPNVKRVSVRLSPFSLRLSEAERKHLEKRAGKLPLGTYIRSQILGSCRSNFNDQAQNRKFCAHILAKLGQADLYRTLSSLSEAAKYGALHVTPEMEADLTRACSDIASMKSLLMQSIGIKED